MSRAERGAISESAVLALGAVTSLVVLVTTTVAVMAATADEKPTGRTAVTSGAAASSRPTAGETSPSVPVPSGPEPVFPDGQVVYGDREANVTFQVPAEYEGWDLESSSVVYFYELPNGDPDVKVHGPAAYRQGTCPDNGNSTSQAYIGVSAVTEESLTSLEDAQEVMTRRWTRAVRRDDEGGPPAPVGEPRTRDVTTASGRPARRSSVVVTTAGRTCAAPKTQVIVQTTDVGASLTTVVMVRDAGRPGTLSVDSAREIMDSIDAEIVPE